MQRVYVIALLLLLLSCDSALVYTTQNSDDATGISAAVVWRYTLLMNRLLAKDFDSEKISKPQFVNAFTQKTMGVFNKRLTSDVTTAIKFVGVFIALQGKFPADSKVGKGLKKFVDAATALGVNTDKTLTQQLSNDTTEALMALFEDAESRKALATQGKFISERLKGPPDIMAEIFDEEFINEILAIKETDVVREVVDIPIFFDEMVKSMHIVLNDAELMEEMSDPIVIGAVSTVLGGFFILYRELHAEQDDRNINYLKSRVAYMLDRLSEQRRTSAILFSEALWEAARPVHFKNLRPNDKCDSPDWQAVQDLDGTSLINNLPDEAITALQLCRLSTRSCDDWGDWSIWTPSPNTTCEGETLEQTRTRKRICPVPCNLTDCATTDTETQKDVSGTKVCEVEPQCSTVCDTGCDDWETWEAKAWLPPKDSVCGGQKMRQRRSRVQRRVCP